MHIGILGINHKSADLWLREILAKGCQRRFGSDNSMHPCFAYVLLSTCNRTEIYFSSSDLAQTHTYLLAILRSEVEGEFEHRIYSYFGRDCFAHLACVTAGVDSALIGETEIQGQVRRAYEGAAEIKRLSPELHFLFQKCLKIGKNIRTKRVLTHGLPSIEEAILQASENVLGDLRCRRILFVGVSEINHKIFVRFKERGFHLITFCNRTDEKTERLAEQEGVKVLVWEELEQWESFDLTIFGTKSPDFLISSASPMGGRRVIIDLSVPRNVDPQLGRHKQITLLNVDQLSRMVERGQRMRASELVHLETEAIGSVVERQMMIFKLKELQRLEIAL